MLGNVAIRLLIVAAQFETMSFTEDLGSLQLLRNGRQTDFAAAEELAADLLAKYTDSIQAGLIHYQMAHIYAQSGHPNPQRLMFHAEAALASPLDMELRLRLFVYYGRFAGYQQIV